MNKRGRNDHLSSDDKENLHRLIREGKYSTAELARMFNMSGRAVCIHKAKMQGRGPQGASLDEETWRKMRLLCRHEDCQADGTGKPPYCDRHRPAAPAKYQSEIAPIPIKRLMGGRA